MSSTAAQTRIFHLPDVGEGLTEAEIVAWRVAVGDTVTVNQVLVDIETAKSIVELPSPYAGVVLRLIAAEGQTVPVDDPIIEIGPAGGGSAAVVEDPAPAGAAAEKSARSTAESAGATESAGAEEPKLLVGYGATDLEHVGRRRGAAAAVAQAPSDAPAAKPRAKPPVRKLARELGIELSAVPATGPNGTVTRDDVLRSSSAAALAGPASGPAAVGPEEQEVTSIPIKGVRKRTAEAMVASAFTAPHVTEFVTIDVTRMLELRKRLQQRREFAEIKLTPLAFVARAYLRAMAKTPMAAARWDEAGQQILVPHSFNLGIAAATPRGLLVPNIKRADALDLAGLATALTELTATARAGRTQPADLAGGHTTITNIGVFGIDTGTPILNPGETSILAVGAIQRRPWVVEDEHGERLEARSVLQLALSFDHRVLDGAEGSQLLADTAALLSDPALAFL